MARAVTWSAIAGGLAAWTAQLLASYLLIDFACARGGTGQGLVAPLLLISLACAAVAAAATALATRRAFASRGSAQALYVGGALLNALSLITILFGAALPLLFEPCLR